MAMNFFQHQEAARKRTSVLILYFILAVCLLIFIAYLLFAGIYVYTESKPGAKDVSWWHPGIFAAVSGVTLLLVGGCSLVKIAELSSGGKAIALMLGGQEIVGSRRADLKEKRLLNIVEEMSIASGVPMPPVYVLENESGINAFAAGYSPGDAVVAVSRGCLNHLSRDELQGVVAHEFSHILNGDMRMNIRLIAIVAGILGLALIGEAIMRSVGNSRSSKDSKGKAQLFMLGLGLWLLGLGGAFFGNLIKAAVSRQREYLADASAVQFTRNPDGIGGALKKIGGLATGSKLDAPRAGEVSHMFFADGIGRLSSLMATHPPLEDRIRRIDPGWDGTWPKVRHLPDSSVGDESAPRSMPAIPGVPQVLLPILIGAEEAAVERVGKVTPLQAERAAGILASIPEPLLEASRDPFTARALIYGLLLDPRSDIREAQLARLNTEAEPQDYVETTRLWEPLAGLTDAARLPLVDLCVPALRRMSPGQYEIFRTQIENLTLADSCVSVFEFVLRVVLERHLDDAFKRPKPAPRKSAGLLTSHVATVVALLAWEGHEDDGEAAKAFDAGMSSYLRGKNTEPMPARDQCALPAFEQSLRLLAGTSMGAKRRILMACAACAVADKQVTIREAELYRAVADVLGCPNPPIPAMG